MTELEGRWKEIEQEVDKEVADITAFLESEAVATGETIAEPKTWKPAAGADPYATCFDRRSFLKGGAALVGGLAVSFPLQAMMARRASASPFPARTDFPRRHWMK